MRTLADRFYDVRDKVVDLFGEQIALSYPVPELVGGVRAEKYFLYYVSSKAERCRPVGSLMVEMESGALMQYQDARVCDFVDTAAHPLDAVISYALPEKMGVKQFKADQERLLVLLDAVSLFAFAPALSREQKAQLAEAEALFARLTPTALIPYYEALSKDFLAWKQSLA